MTAHSFRSRFRVVAIQAAVSVAALTLLAYMVDWREALAVLERIGVYSAAAALLAATASHGLGALRLHLMLRACAVSIRFRDTLSLTWVGLFSGNFLPSTIGGDALCALTLTRKGYPVVASLVGLVGNRLVNFAAILLSLPTVFLLPQVRALTDLFLPASGMLLLLLAAAGLGGAALLALWLRPPRLIAGLVARMRPAVSALVRRPWIGASALGLSFAMLMLGAAAMLCLGWAIVPDYPAVAMFAVMVAVMAFQAVPLSINGIGVQEALITVCLVKTGWGAPEAAAFSVLVRVLVIVATLPGLPAAFQVWKQLAARPAAAPPRPAAPAGAAATPDPS